MKTTEAGQPHWWTDTHASAWEHVKEALARDWEQTKADFGKLTGHEQHANTASIQQVAIAEMMPSATIRNERSEAVTRKNPTYDSAFDYSDVEPALRYGHGASSQFTAHTDWNDKLEAELRADWDHLRQERSWDEVKAHVRRGWEHARRQPWREPLLRAAMR